MKKRVERILNQYLDWLLLADVNYTKDDFIKLLKRYEEGITESAALGIITTEQSEELNDLIRSYIKYTI